MVDGKDEAPEFDKLDDEAPADAEPVQPDPPSPKNDEVPE